MINTLKKTAHGIGTAVVALMLSTNLIVPITPAIAAPAQEKGNATSIASAALPKISGVEYLTLGSSTWDILRLDGDYDQPLFFSFKLDGTYLMKDAPYVAGGGSTDNSEAEYLADILTLDMSKVGVSASGQATLESVFGDISDHPSIEVSVRSEKFGDPVFEGSIYPVYAALKNSEGAIVSHALLGICTVAKGAEADKGSIAAGTTFYRFPDGASNAANYDIYALDSRTPVFDAQRSSYVLDYSLAGNSADVAVTGTVTYVDQDGKVIQVDSVPMVNGSAIPTIRSAFVADGGYYRVINRFAVKAPLTPQQSNLVVPVVKVELANGQAAYEAVVEYIDEDGNLLWSDSIDVLGSSYCYSLPEVFSMKTAAGVNAYELIGLKGESAALLAAANGNEGPARSNTIMFGQETGEHVVDGVLNVQAVYESDLNDGKVNFTIQSIDGVTGQVFATDTVTVTPENKADNPVTFDPKSKVEINGTTYVLWSGDAAPLRFSWDALSSEETNLLQYLYYVPEGYIAAGPYDISVQYLDIASGERLQANTMTVDPESNSYIQIGSPEKFAQNGEEYVRLAGQSAPIMHSYLTPARQYTVYYRNVNDVLNSRVVINRTQIIETERVEPVAGGGITAVATETEEGLIETGVSEGDGAVIIDDDANPLATLDGDDTATERIMDNENPLASNEAAAGLSGIISGVLVPLLIGVLALAIAGLVIVIQRRRKNDDRTTRNQA